MQRKAIHASVAWLAIYGTEPLAQKPKNLWMLEEWACGVKRLQPLWVVINLLSGRQLRYAATWLRVPSAFWRNQCNHTRSKLLQDLYLAICKGSNTWLISAEDNWYLLPPGRHLSCCIPTCSNYGRSSAWRAKVRLTPRFGVNRNDGLSRWLDGVSFRRKCRRRQQSPAIPPFGCNKNVRYTNEYNLADWVKWQTKPILRTQLLVRRPVLITGQGPGCRMWSKHPEKNTDSWALPYINQCSRVCRLCHPNLKFNQRGPDNRL